MIIIIIIYIYIKSIIISASQSSHDPIISPGRNRLAPRRDERRPGDVRLASGAWGQCNLVMVDGGYTHIIYNNDIVQGAISQFEVGFKLYIYTLQSKEAMGHPQK